ncbi:3-keto-5-aminohexanoate cleavage protein [Pseudogemmobacter blasticus]|uniref:NADPH:quinone reductase n=1 Tax=Fuscovulum blasticum DSM 2131 TaxID=1188250 RepID=A0A2T4J6B3_FUSBL|nr:3-keto-5-aminohexanoate cleavage protein [Fuscovulum blasticum]PTE13439.1 NADPH:quinone reductase [Fuscovulum blasticum DSM 2131]
MSRPVILTACINGGRPDAAALNPNLPVTPAQIAAAVAEAAALGAAVAHVHVRDPKDGRPSNDPGLWAETVARIRATGADILLNLSASMDGLLYLDDEAGFALLPASTLRPVSGRTAHVIAARPEIGTMDCGTFAMGPAIHVARIDDLREMARLYARAGIRAEVECFDFGHLEIARRLVAEGLLGARPFLQICLGTGYGGAPATRAALLAMYERIPEGAVWAAFAAAEENLWVAREAVALGGHVRAGLEDTLFDSAGLPTTNAALLTTAVAIITGAGGRPAKPAEARQILDLPANA